jgi:RimJ/RimL family protein N-acetyltransferase
MLSYSCLQDQRISSGEYCLIPVQEEHIDSIRQWRNQQMKVLRQGSIITETQQKLYFSEKIWPELNRRNPSNILMGLLYEDRLIGYGGLVHIAWEHRRAEVSFLLATERARDPEIYANDFNAYLGLIKFLALGQLALNRLFTETYHFRERHIHILENAGFVREGVLRQHIFLDGIPIDSLIHGILLN